MHINSCSFEYPTKRARINMPPGMTSAMGKTSFRKATFAIEEVGISLGYEVNTLNNCYSIQRARENN